MNFSQRYFNTPMWVLCFFFTHSFLSYSQQNVSISDVQTAPDPSSVLDIFSTSKGLLIPRMNSNERLAIVNPSNALLVFDTDSSCFLFYRVSNLAWYSLCDFSQGPIGPPGDDGIHIENTVVNTSGDLIVTLTDGTVLNAGNVIGPDGAQGLPGNDGADGTNGTDGTNGIDGAQGPIGLTGAAGSDGADGLPGPSWTLTAPSFNTNGTMVVNGTAGSGGPVTSTAGAWLLDGNTNTAVKGFGTNSNTHVDFETNGITRGRFLNTGEMLWGNTGIIAPAMAGDPLHSYVVNNTNNWAFNAINTTAQGGSVFGSNTSMANAFSGIEGSTNGTGSGIKGMHMAISGGGIGIQGVTNSPAAAWAGIFMGDIGLTGAIWNISDARFKKNILPVSSVLAKVMELKVKKYNMRADEFPGLSLNPNKSEFGFIAQELKEVFPEIVQQKAIPDPLVLNSNKQNKEMVEGYYTVNYISLVPILTKAIQEQQNQILALNEQIGLQTQIDFSNLTQSRIIASDNARLNSENIFTANLDSKPYIIGVFEIDAIGNQKIQTNGVVTVDADNENGQILAGDHVTVSSLGKAVKSINQEWVLGVAVANEASGLVEVRIDIRFKH